MADAADIGSDFAALIGQDAWGVSRIHGSMFFLEIGEKKTDTYEFRGEQCEAAHGKWCFMFSMVQWRFEKSGRITIACEDGQQDIDDAFRQMVLGPVVSASATTAGRDLTINFGTGVSLTTFSNTANRAEWDQWTLYCPDDRFWAADGRNNLISGVGAQPRPEGET